MKVYILEFWVHDYGDSYSDILGVYTSLDYARDFIDNAGYRYEDYMLTNYIETYSKEDENGVYKTISILERDLNKDYSFSSVED
ncbi:hypothetical protein ABNB56_11420 [Streptococcus iniae]|uniref:hypothetical protein n=1 Tax=Streptococcus iniae TaxID=1346 RepID=UPI000EFAC351|nr:hypothetical protein [Streptococcus iniae]RMI77646.1 hypothetical protein DIX58_04205 [Streptococcus iniae]